MGWWLLLGAHRQILNDIRILENHGIWVVLQERFLRRQIGFELHLLLAFAE
jgi:hypothetical protein